MHAALSILYLEMRAAAEAKAGERPLTCIEDYFLGLLKLCEVDPKDIAESPAETAKAIDEDLRAVRRLIREAGIEDTKKARRALRGILREKGGGESEMRYVRAAEARAAARNQSLIYAQDLVGAILDDPGERIREILGPKRKEEAKADKTPSAERGPRLRELSERVRTMRRHLKERVFGQDEAVSAFCEGIFAAELLAEADADRKAPKAVFVFAGPPGVGKTYLAEEGASALSYPFMRFDMSGYADHQSWLGLVGFEKSYHEAKEGTLTGFVRKNPGAVLLFDEVEKAHLNTVHLFLQILDGGKLCDRFLGEDVSFRDTVIIFTTNAGRSLYEGQGGAGGPALRQRLISALQTEKRPGTDEPFFPAAIASRLASGCPLLFSALGAKDKCAIIERELKRLGGLFEKQYGIPVTLDSLVPSALLMREGGADARTLRAQTERYFKECVFRLTGLFGRRSFENTFLKLKEIRFAVDTGEMDADARAFFYPAEKPAVVFCGSGSLARWVEKALPGAEVIAVKDADEALKAAGEREIRLILAQLAFGGTAPFPGETVAEEDLLRTAAGFSGMPIGAKALRESVRLLGLFRERMPDIPVWLAETEGEPIGEELLAELSQLGARGRIAAGGGSGEAFSGKLEELLSAAFREDACTKLASGRRILTFDTVPALNASGDRLCLRLRNFRTGRAVAASDTGTLLEEADRPDVRFSDVVGAASAKEELGFFAEFLKNPRALRAKGFRPPKGVLLYGPPGTGKTLLAKAFAGETQASFIASAASAFVTKYQGSGPASVRSLFESARRYAPAVLFIDEIDAIGRKRGEAGAGHGEEMALNALLTEMDGFSTDPSRPVFVVAATNFDIEEGGSGAGVLDPALVRRFDRRILVDLPDVKDREELLHMLLSKRPGHAVREEDVARIAKRSVGMSPAALTDVCETAARMAAREGKVLSGALLEEALELTRHGEKKDWGIGYLERVAVHESGHALVSFAQGRMPSFLTITARGSHGGYMEDAAVSKTPIYTRAELLGRIRTCLAGRASELVFYGEEEGLSTGASDDLQQATRLACAMLGCYGMDEKRGLFAGSLEEAMKDGEVRREAGTILAEQLKAACTVLQKNRKKARRLADALLAKNSLNEEEIRGILEGE